MKFTFKTDKPTGRYRSFYNDYHHIKLNKKCVGNIADKTWRINLFVYRDDKPDDFKVITLMKKPNSLQEAKDFLNETIDAILSKYKLYKLD